MSRRKIGFSLVEVVVACAIVLLMSLMFSTIVSASVNLYRKAAQLRETGWEYQEEYYTTEAYNRRAENDCVVLKGLRLVEETTKGAGDEILLGTDCVLQSYPSQKEELGSVRWFSFRIPNR